jgi:hypothetical protein
MADAQRPATPDLLVEPAFAEVVRKISQHPLGVLRNVEPGRT